MVRALENGSAGVNKINELGIHPLGPRCTYDWWWGGLQSLQLLELSVNQPLWSHLLVVHLEGFLTPENQL